MPIQKANDKLIAYSEVGEKLIFLNKKYDSTKQATDCGFDVWIEIASYQKPDGSIYFVISHRFQRRNRRFKFWPFDNPRGEGAICWLEHFEPRWDECGIFGGMRPENHLGQTGEIKSVATDSFELAKEYAEWYFKRLKTIQLSLNAEASIIIERATRQKYLAEIDAKNAKQKAKEDAALARANREKNATQAKMIAELFDSTFNKK